MVPSTGFAIMTEEELDHFFKSAKEMEKNLIGSLEQITISISQLKKRMDEQGQAFVKEVSKQKKIMSELVHNFKIGHSVSKDAKFNP